MPQFLIERHIPGASTLTAQALRDIALQSEEIIAGFGEPYSWITSYVAGDAIYCVHEAASAEAVYRHSRAGGFPADVVTEISAQIGPRTAQG